ncbi:MAG TPA: zinc-ribbon domain-containing protein [Blastocatellia bacterium]
MARFCTQCGAQVDETAKFCKKCGARLAPTQPSGYSAPTINYQTSNYQGPPDFGPGQQPYQQPYQVPAPQADLKPNIAGMLCYPLSFISGILFLALTPYNRDRFVRFHAWQSIFFFIAMMALSVAAQILPWPVDWVSLRALRLLALAGTGWLMYKAYHNERFKLPIIGDWAERQSSKNEM